MIYSPLGGGVLTGKYKAGEAPPPDSRAGRGGLWARMRLSHASRWAR
jgi:aryl-alcohol dehydrogenase-like predicted oxidoreductase